jgi:hypothetical protein
MDSPLNLLLGKYNRVYDGGRKENWGFSVNYHKRAANTWGKEGM